MFAVLAEAAVERGEGEIRGKEEAKAEGTGAQGGGGRGKARVRTRRVEPEGSNSCVRGSFGSLLKYTESRLRIRRVSTHRRDTYLARGVKN